MVAGYFSDAQLVNNSTDCFSFAISIKMQPWAAQGQGSLIIVEHLQDPQESSAGCHSMGDDDVRCVLHLSSAPTGGFAYPLHGHSSFIVIIH